jgi:hypothetical protein
MWKEANEAQPEAEEKQSKWSRWKQGGIIGAAVSIGRTWLAVTGGLAAPAIAAGFDALAPTFSIIILVIGVDGFAIAASAAGPVVGPMVVVISFGAAGGWSYWD